jgi:hypothetical protein
MTWMRMRASWREIQFSRCRVSVSDKGYLIFVRGFCFWRMCAGLVVVAMKGGVAIDPFVVSICSDQLNDATQPTDAIILKGKD